MRFGSDAIPVHEGIPFKDVFLLVLVNIAVIPDYVPMLLHEPGVVNWWGVDK
jgi:hypothetical protein